MLLANGCRLFQKQNLEHLSLTEQKKMILEFVPLGTSREMTIKKLDEAGIVGDFSPVPRTVYYCQYRLHPGGKKQSLSIALLFNEKGIFYATKPGEARIDAE